MSVKVYYHKKCTTCKKALKFLEDNGVDYKGFVITEKAPSVAELKKALASVGALRKLFNTSGMEYRSRNLKDKIPNMSDEEAFDMLSSNGMLVKRPFLITPKGVLVGFKQAEWEELFT